MSYDIHLEGVQDSLRKTDVLTFGNYEKPLAVRGIHKMAARFLKCFLTPKGTDPSDPDYGTTLMASFNASISSSDLHALATQSVQEVQDKLEEYDSEYLLDDDERLFSSELKNIIVDEENQGVELWVSIRSVDGTVALFSFPLEGTSNG